MEERVQPELDLRRYSHDNPFAVTLPAVCLVANQKNKQPDKYMLEREDIRRVRSKVGLNPLRETGQFF